MQTLDITLNTGAIYSLIGIIRGEVTSGVTKAPTTGTRPGQPMNVNRLVLKAGDGNGAIVVSYGDAGIATDGTSGMPMLAGDVQIFQAPPSPTLNFYLAVSANGGVVHVAWD